MLRLLRSPRPLVALSRGFAARPVRPVDEAAAVRRQQAGYYARITRKYPQAWGKPIPMELLDRTTRFLEARGFSRSKALQAIAKHPGLANYSHEMIESKIAYLGGLGLSRDKINAMILRSPNILGCSFEKLQQLEKWYNDHGVPTDKIPYVLTVFPGAVTSSIEHNLDAKVDFLKEHGCSDKQISRFLSLAPQILALSTERMQENIDFLLELGVPREKLPELIARCPPFLALRSERIQATLDTMEEMFGQGTALDVLKSHFRIIMYNINGVRRSFKYLVSLGFTPERLQMNTQFIIRGVSGILRPRSKFLQAQGVDVVANIEWIMMPERVFVERHPDYEAYLLQYKKRLQKKSSTSI